MNDAHPLLSKVDRLLLKLVASRLARSPRLLDELSDVVGNSLRESRSRLEEANNGLGRELALRDATRAFKALAAEDAGQHSLGRWQ